MEAKMLSAQDSGTGETGVFRLTENGSGRIVTGETGLAHTRTGIQSVLDSWECTWCAFAQLEFVGRHLLVWRRRAERNSWQDGFGRAHAYPLSMTRAATSSVKEAHVSDQFEADEDADGWRRWWPAASDEAEAEREERH